MNATARQAPSDSAANQTAFDVVILGAGFAGLGMAIALRKAGMESFVLLEKADEVGGTWRDNTYPGCACDVPSHLYSFSFEKCADWSRMFPTQPEILGYLRRVADKYALRPHIRFGAEAVEAAFDEGAGRWRVCLRDGTAIWARFLVSGMGGLSRPAFPAIPGIERFCGPAFHSADWRHDVDLAGRRVAVIGTGASAIQFVPQIAPKVAQLRLFQRTPPWIVPKPDRPLAGMERMLLRHVPGYMSLFRAQIYWAHEMRALGFTVNPRLMQKAQRFALAHLHRQVADPALRQKLTPDYTMGCKRVLLADDYYPALTRPNVELVTEPIAEIAEDAVITRDGKRRTVDVLIYGTGFRATDYISPMQIFGRNGVDLNDIWARAAEAYYGITVAGFPNLFLLIGPNTGLGHNSMVFMIEAQVNYVMQCLKLLRRRGNTVIDLRPDVQETFNADLQRRIARTVWASGCRSWYLDARGRNTTLWPGFTFEYWWRTLRARQDDYTLSGAP